jgi:hypothetical protein
MASYTHSRIPTAEQAALIKGMIARGDMQHDVAAFFGLNSGRISEVNTGKRYPEVAPAPAHMLPPPGPYGAGAGRSHHA